MYRVPIEYPTDKAVTISADSIEELSSKLSELSYYQDSWKACGIPAIDKAVEMEPYRYWVVYVVLDTHVHLREGTWHRRTTTVEFDHPLDTTKDHTATLLAAFPGDRDLYDAVFVREYWRLNHE
jgi:hypothetical protein